MFRGTNRLDRFFLTVLALSTSSSGAGSPGSTSPDSASLDSEALLAAEDIEVTRLRNGVRVATERVPGTRAVSLGVWVGVGARDEAVEFQGASHFLEHMLFKGTETRSAKDISLAVDRVGGYMNAFTGHESTAFEMMVPAPELSMATSLLSDVLIAPAFRAADTEAERMVILEELRGALDQPEDVIDTRLAETIFAGHGLGLEVLGNPETLRNISPTELASFHRRWYRPNNMVVCAAGDLDHDQIIDQLAGPLDAVDPGDTPQRVAPPPLESSVLNLQGPTEQVHLRLGYRSLPAGHKDSIALGVASHVLGQGPASRLFEEVREQRGLAYSVWAGGAGYLDAGEFTVSTAVAPSRFDEALEVIDRCVAQCRDEGITKPEFDRARSAREGGLMMGLQSTTSRMYRLAHELLVHDRIVPYAEDLAELANLTIDDANRAINEVLSGPRVQATLSPINPPAETITPKSP